MLRKCPKPRILQWRLRNLWVTGFILKAHNSEPKSFGSRNRELGYTKLSSVVRIMNSGMSCSPKCAVLLHMLHGTGRTEGLQQHSMPKRSFWENETNNRWDIHGPNGSLSTTFPGKRANLNIWVNIWVFNPSCIWLIFQTIYKSKLRLNFNLPSL